MSRPPAPASTASGWQRHGWFVLALWAVILAAYSNSLHTGFVLDNS